MQYDSFYCVLRKLYTFNICLNVRFSSHRLHRYHRFSLMNSYIINENETVYT